MHHCAGRLGKIGIARARPVVADQWIVGQQCVGSCMKQRNISNDWTQQHDAPINPAASQSVNAALPPLRPIQTLAKMGASSSAAFLRHPRGPLKMSSVAVAFLVQFVESTTPHRTTPTPQQNVLGQRGFGYVT